MIKQYTNDAAYAAAGQPTDESRVAQIASTREVKVDGVNVLVPFPGDGDIVLYDADGNDRFIKRGTVRKSLIDASWTHVGYAFGVKGKSFKVLDKEFPTATLQWLSCWQFSITSITSTSIRFWLKMAGNYGTFVEISVSLSSAAINATTVAEINAALEAAGNSGNVGYANHGYWAYLADENGNKVSSGGTQIIVQCDFNGSYQQYQCSDGSHALSGLSMALAVWGDMPANSSLMRESLHSTTWGFWNIEKGYSYYSNSGATPTADVALKHTNIVNLASFENSAYCADLRRAYGDYRTYLRANKVRDPHPSYGVFGLPDAEEMTSRYGNATFPKKDGSEDWKYPALHYGTTIGYGSGPYATGKWHLQDVDDNVLEDNLLAKLQQSQRDMGTTVITNSVGRWLVRRYGATNAWFFNGSNGGLGNNYGNNRYRCQAVTLRRLD